MQLGIDVQDDATQQAAEQVRAHLVSLRGGAPFLSSADGQLLLTWLDAQVPVAQICAAIELAADARRKRPSRIPLSLGHAKRHMKKVVVPTRGDATASSGHPLAPLAKRLQQERGDAGPVMHELARTLLALPVDPELAEAGIEAMRLAREALWNALSETERTERLDDAMLRLGDLPTGLDPSIIEAAAEEQARLEHLGQWPWLSAHTIWELALQ